MIKQILLLCLLVVLSISFSSEVIALAQQLDLPCQYQEIVLSETPISVLYDTAGMSYENPITLKDFKSGVSEEGKCICQTSFDVINLVGKEVKVKINYQLNLSVNDKMNITDRIRTHILRGFAKRTNYDGGEICKGACQIIENDITPEYLPTNETFGKWEKANLSICEPCNSKPCLNDGERCELASECGGKHCVQSLCSNNEFCYNNDCKCSESEVQCENQRCIKKSSVPNGLQPFCSWEECESRFQNSTSGLCQTHPDEILKVMETKQIQEQESTQKQLRNILMFVFGTLFLGLFYYIFNSIHKKEMRLLEIEKMKVKKDGVTQLELELKKLQQIKIQTAKERESIAKLEKDKERSLQTIEELERKNRTWLEELEKPRKSSIFPTEVWEWLNPKFSYPCFVNKDESGKFVKKTDILIHKKVAKKHIFDEYHDFFTKYYLNYEFEDLQVHHIDRNPLNYRADNLIILTKEQHENIRNENIRLSDRESGIKELLRLQLKAPHITELKPREM